MYAKKREKKKCFYIIISIKKKLTKTAFLKNVWNKGSENDTLQQ